MNAILGMIDLAVRKTGDPLTRDFLHTAKEAADVLLALLNDLLDSAKIEAGKLELESVPFSLRHTLDQISRVFGVRANERGLQFLCQIPDDVPDVLVGDAVRLRQILFNLAGNAIKFTEKGEVEIRVRTLVQDSEEASLEFSVRDTGIGIPGRQRERLFKPFAQADASIARRFGGTGLGLSICARLVAMMGGRIWVESALGEGSTFYFTMQVPLAKESLSEASRVVRPDATPSRRLNILLVEDNPANQKLATYVLQERGHRVEIAGDGYQALRMTQESRYDAILMDVQMPGMDGLETAAAIRARENSDARIPIIAMTAHAMKGDRDRCLAAGMDGYLSKPIDGCEVIAVVESLAARPAVDGVTPLAPIEPMRSPTAGVFDPELALKRCLEKRNLLQEMISFFFKDADSFLPQIRAALQKGDLVEVGRWDTGSKGLLPTLAQRRQEKLRSVWNVLCYMLGNKPKPRRLSGRSSGSARC